MDGSRRRPRHQHAWVRQSLQIGSGGWDTIKACLTWVRRWRASSTRARASSFAGIQDQPSTSNAEHVNDWIARIAWWSKLDDSRSHCERAFCEACVSRSTNHWAALLRSPCILLADFDNLFISSISCWIASRCWAMTRFACLCLPIKCITAKGKMTQIMPMINAKSSNPAKALDYQQSLRR